MQHAVLANRILPQTASSSPLREDPLRPDPDAATLYVRQLERQGLAPTPIQARVAAGRGLDAGLRWCRAGTMDPFAHGRVPHAPPPAWDKRLPYAEDEVAALLQAAMDPADYVLVLLGAHAGLRAPEQECGDVRGAEVPRARRDRVVRCGKGGKQRIVALSATHLTARLAGAAVAGGRLGLAGPDGGPRRAAQAGAVPGGGGDAQGGACPRALGGDTPVGRDARPGGDGAAPGPCQAGDDAHLRQVERSAVARDHRAVVSTGAAAAATVHGHTHVETRSGVPTAHGQHAQQRRACGNKPNAQRALRADKVLGRPAGQQRPVPLARGPGSGPIARREVLGGLNHDDDRQAA